MCLEINKKKKFFIGVIICIVLMIALVMIIVLGNSNKRNNINDKKDDNITNDKIENQPKYICKRELQNTENFVTYLIESFDVKNERIMSVSSDIMIVSKTVDYYNSLKEIKEYAEGKIFNDKDKTISYPNGEDIDYTKTPDGEDIIVKYSEFIKELEQIDYICE